MPIFVPDTSVIVPALTDWHPDYALADRAINERLDRGDEMILAAPSVVESYSSLTRMPPPNRLSPRAAMRLLRDGIITNRRVVALGADAYLELLEDAARRGISGGSIYDAVIAACARRG